ncbi:MAG: hypothetical protein ACLP0J_15155 [Solirubrobacteraceae bacterium]
MNAAFLIGGLVLLTLGGGLARNGMTILRGGSDRLRSARARALAETAFGGVYAVLGVTAVSLGFIGRRRLPTLVGTVILVAMLGLFAAAGVGSAAGRAAAWSERRHTRRAQRELGMVSPQPLWRVTTIGVMWALAFVVACLVWAVGWSVAEGAAHHWRAASPQSVHRALVVLLAVTVPLALLHMGLQAVRLHNRVRQFTEPAVEEGPSTAAGLSGTVACPALWCSGERCWMRRIGRQRAVHVPLLRLARTGTSPVVATRALPAWATVAVMFDVSRWSVAAWRVDLASGERRIVTIVVARPGKSGAHAVFRWLGRHPFYALVAFLAGAIAASSVWQPGGAIFAAVVAGGVSVGGLLVPILRGDVRAASGEELGVCAESAH